jgi:lysophospholipase L1-like esterase
MTMRNKNIVMFDNFKNGSTGVWYFVPNDMGLYKKRKPCKGFGAIRYSEGSVYTGEIYFDGKSYNKIGYGQQDFTNSTLGSIDPFINERKYMYVGAYDYRKTDWIYGNGVLYYKDINGNPSRFVKGFFSGLDITGPYSKEFDYTSLLPGYTKEMESDYNPRKHLFKAELKNYENITDLETLFVGDSYFEFWYYNQFAKTTFKNAFDTSKTLNVGLGGTKFVDWYEYIPLLKGISEPKNIVVNLGFNDLHSSFSPKKVYNDFKKFLQMFREIFPNSNYYFLNVCHAPGFVPFYERENLLNEMMEQNAIKNNITIIHNSEAVAKRETEIHCYDVDDCHLNHSGYEVMEAVVKAVLDKNM